MYRETKIPQKLLFSGNGNPKKLFIFQTISFRARKLKPTLKKKIISSEMALSSLKIKTTVFLGDPLKVFYH